MQNIEHRKTMYTPRTLDAEIVADGVSALSHLEGSSFSKDSYFLVGGVATQSYLPSTCRRATGDIDFTAMKHLGLTDFKKFVEPAADVLRSMGYDVAFHKGRVTIKLIYGTPDKGSNLIETPRIGIDAFKSYEPMFQREFARSRKKHIEGREGDICVCSPEDIIIPKISRSALTLSLLPDLRDESKTEYNPKVNDEYVRRSLDLLRQMKEQVTLSPTNLELANRARFAADVYDVKLLSVLAGCNENLMKEAFKDWPRMQEHPVEARFLVEKLLPNMAF